MKRLLLVLSQALLRQSLAEQLSAKGFAVSTASSPAGEPADLAVVDLDGLEESAAALCRGLQGSGVPVILLKDGDDTAAALPKGFHAVAKPFRFADLLRRIEEVLGGEGALRIGGLRLFRGTREISDSQGRRVRLTEKETAILAYLHAAGERAVPRAELLDEVWGYAQAASTHTVASHIHRLRRKLAEGLGGTGLLRTEPGGYRLAG